MAALSPSTLGALSCMLLLLSLSALLPSSAQPMPDMSPDAQARKSDLPFLKCAVCKKMVDEIWWQVSSMRRAAKPRKVEEYKIVDVLEKVCDRKKKEADWILRTDIVEDGDELKLEEQEEEGECLEECRTLEYTCKQVLGDHDLDIGEALVKNEAMTKNEMREFICNKQTKACQGATPPLPKDRKPGPPFEKKRPVDYGAMAKEMGIKSSVMHDNLPSGFGNSKEPPQILKKKEKKGKKSSKKGHEDKAPASDDGADSSTEDAKVDEESSKQQNPYDDQTFKVLQEAQEVAKKGTKAAREWVAKVTNTPVEDREL